jgi:HEAT repeat protein
MAKSLQSFVPVILSFVICSALVQSAEVVDNNSLNRALEQGTAPDVIYLKLKMSACHFDDSLDALTLVKKAAEKGGWPVEHVTELQQKIMLLAADDKRRRVEAVAKAMTTFENDDPVECEQTFAALRKEGRAIIPEILDQLDQESERKRAGLLSALTQIGQAGEKSDAVLAHALRMLNDSAPQVREEAARCVAALGGTAVYDVLVARLSDRDKPLDGVCRALGHVGDARAVAPLTHVLRRSTDADTRVSAATALGQLRAGTRDARSALLESVLDEHDARLRDCAAAALASIGDKQTPEYIIKACERYRTGREQIIKHLSAFKCAASINFLLQQLDSDTPSIRKAANETLRNLTQENFSTPDEWASWWDLAKVRPSWIQVESDYSRVPSPFSSPKSDDTEPFKAGQ